MFPYADTISGTKRGVGPLALIGMLFAVHVVGASSEALRAQFVGDFSFTPLRFSSQPFLSSYTLATASFVHGDWLHLLGNCLFLLVFGTTLETLFGRRVFWLAFPLLGVFGFLLQWATSPDSATPVVGASGAIAALMGAYLALFPSARLRMIVFWGIAWKRFSLPAWAFLFYWFTSQLFSWATGSDSTIAFAVHVGSFLAGLLAAVMWKTAYWSAEEHLQATIAAAQERASLHSGRR